MSDQIALLLALNEHLFDSAPIDRMAEAQMSLSDQELPAELRARLDSSEELRGEDCETILNIARKALARFQSQPAGSDTAKSHARVFDRPSADHANQNVYGLDQ